MALSNYLSNYRIFVALLFTWTITALSSCGGGSGSALDDSGSGSSSSSSSSSGSGSSSSGGNTINVSITSNNLDGVMAVTLGEQSRTFLSNSTFLVSDLANDGSIQAVITTIPDNQVCAFTNNDSHTTDLAASLTILCEYIIDINFIAQVYEDSDSVINTGTATLIIESGETSQRYELTTTGSDGLYVLEDYMVTGNETEVILRFDAPGYLSNTIPIQLNSNGDNIDSRHQFTAYHSNQSINPSTENNLTIDGATVSIPADSFTNPAGASPTGNVTLYFSVIDPSSSSGEFPGNSSTRQEGSSSPSYFEYFGGFAIEAVDADGQPLQIASGSQITVSSPAVTAEGNTLPALPSSFNFNPETTYWEASESASFSLSGNSYDISIDSLGAWAPAEIYEHVSITGCVRDSFNRPITNILMIAEGISYLGTTSSYPDSGGHFTLYAKAGGQEVIVYGRGEYTSNTVKVVTGTEAIELDNCIFADPESIAITLSWGENPSDLDSHLTGPNGSGGQFLIYYIDKTTTVNGKGIFLDVDDTTSFGPEITTITRLAEAGTYSFYVHLYGGTGSTFTSPTEVSHYYREEEIVYTPASEDTTECWHVFDIVATENTTDDNIEFDATFVEQNTWVEESAAYCVPQGGL